jgi:3-hydroxyacyl-CoA dehydrogenase
MAEKIALVGSGLIGRGWAIVFARAAYDVALYDAAEAAIGTAFASIEMSLADLEAMELIPSAAQVRDRMAAASSLAEALDGATYVQESVPEDRDLKHRVFGEMDSLAGAEAILGSSCSAIPGSRFLDVPGRHRCLIAHPVSPPYLVPLVELVPTPWTAEETVARCRRLMEEVGQVPILVNREVFGFVLNRLQAAVVNEAMALVDQGVASPDDVDKSMRHGLGLRWAFMGPFETMDLNADGGFVDYTSRYGASYQAMGAELQVDRPWSRATLERIEGVRRALTPGAGVPERQAWRDRRLMALLKHKAEAEGEIGE